MSAARYFGRITDAPSLIADGSMDAGAVFRASSLRSVPFRFHSPAR